MKITMHRKMVKFNWDDVTKIIKEKACDGNQLFVTEGYRSTKYSMAFLKKIGSRKTTMLFDSTNGCLYTHYPNSWGGKGTIWFFDIGEEKLYMSDMEEIFMKINERLSQQGIKTVHLLLEEDKLLGFRIPAGVEKIHMYYGGYAGNIKEYAKTFWEFAKKHDAEVEFKYEPLTLDKGQQKHENLPDDWVIDGDFIVKKHPDYEKGKLSICESCECDKLLRDENDNWVRFDFADWKDFFLEEDVHCKNRNDYFSDEKSCACYSRQPDGSLSLFVSKDCPYYTEHFMANLSESEKMKTC